MSKRRKLAYSTRWSERDSSRRILYTHLYLDEDGEQVTPNLSVIYVPAIPQIVKALFSNELEEAKKRVIKDGIKYQYSPSHSYIRAISKTFKFKKP